MDNIKNENNFLPGGCENQVEKVGNTVHRKIKGHPLLHEYLLYLEKEGITGVPRFLGLDEQGREILSYLPGKTMGRDIEYDHHCLNSDETLVDMARFMRKLHDISAGFVQTAINGGWENPYFPNGKHEIICHGDAGIWNFVFVDDRVTGLFDFDQAYPGTRFWDLASPLFCFLPSCYSYNPENIKEAEEGKRRLRLFFNAYGMDYPADIIDITARRVQTFLSPEEIATGVGHYSNIINHLKAHGRDWL